jgi:hypothetical protein
MIYIILPKPLDEDVTDGNEAHKWGLSDNEVAVALSPDQEPVRYTDEQFQCKLKSHTKLPRLAETSVVCYSDYRTEHQTEYRQIIHDLLLDGHRVFRHFGNKPLFDMTVAGMQAELSGDNDSFWEERAVMPYSEKGSPENLRWLPLIYAVRDDCFKASTLTMPRSQCGRCWRYYFLSI